MSERVLLAQAKDIVEGDMVAWDGYKWTVVDLYLHDIVIDAKTGNNISGGDNVISNIIYMNLSRQREDTYLCVAEDLWCLPHLLFRVFPSGLEEE